ncbi:MAG TPA: 16S rRNA (uracil(1498)-N(3))-methyltransferase [Patescibacteria group bacterium]|nr:16S rRNA (uracil(1498)-N(3))-methyltransferase [Patescibacteria group bacterium]|tara:strand:- start:499 stop:1239 length:741 start_codon:yes stop_codon:yes gene_type:complete
MHRFFLKQEQLQNNHVFFNPEESKQIKNVLRLSAGDRILVLDNRGNTYTVEISKSDNKTLKGNIIEKQFQKPGNKFSISLGQALTKGSKIDFIIQKATELGVENITFIETERSVVKYKNVQAKDKLKRWEKIAKEAAEQSHRLTIPNVSCHRNLEDFCKTNENAGLKLIFWEEEKEKKLRDCLKNDIGISRLSILIGPEGGFSSKEIELTRKFGFISVGLGPRILKTETAVMSILSIIQYLEGELG